MQIEEMERNMQDNGIKITYIAIKDITPYKNNARKHGETDVAAIIASIKEFGFLDPLAVWSDDNIVVEGHGRLTAAKKLGMKTVPCIRLDDLTDEQRRAYALAHNKTAELSDWDIDLLGLELDDITDIDMSEFGFDLDFSEDEPVEITEDEVPEEVETKAKLGDLWILGSHKLVCGDSTDSAVIDRLMDGVKADIVFTDPPYNIASDSKNFGASASKALSDLSEAEWDKNFEIRDVLDNIIVTLAKDCSVYVCTSHFLAGKIWQWMDEWADHVQYCVWSKPNPMPSLAKRHWTWNTELICYATRGKHTFNFPKEGHALSTWTINKKNGDTGHPTEKPVEVPATAISHSSKENDIVLDLFGGSGSTLIACEQLNRKCYMAELDERYVSVIVNRWLNFTGRKDEIFCIRDGQKLTYDEVFN